jgi:hypothetical protein
MGDRRSKGKHPRAADPPAPRKEPRYTAQPGTGKHPAIAPEGHDQRVSWRFGTADKDGPWGWHSDERLMVVLHDFLCAMEQQRWPTDRSKPIPVAHLCRDAQRRLQERRLDDVDDLVEFRVTGAGRVWGIRQGPVFAFLWWDPRHEVCPSLQD